MVRLREVELVKGRKRRRTVLRGVAASPGQAMGPIYLLVSQEFHVPRRRVPPQAVASEIRRFRGALRLAREEISAVRARLGTNPEDPADQILASHLMIFQDRELMREIAAAIKVERMNAAHAVRRVLVAKTHYLESLPSEVFRTRAADIRDVERRLLGQLLGAESSAGAQIPEGAIVVATEILPSDMAALDPERVAAFVIERGTLASHVTIMARSRGVPAVVGIADIQEVLPENETAIVDGERGFVVVAPSRQDIDAHRASQDRADRLSARLYERKESPGETRDGKRIPVRANIERPGDAAIARAGGAEGVGLFRTEFLFMGAAGFAREVVQQEVYRQVVETFPEHPVTLRTLDLGGDKTASLMGLPREDNPFLGLRGIRFCLEHPEILLVQIRAILRASVGGKAQILLPMISTVSELRRARELVRRAAAELVAAGQETPAEIPVGVMIEVPSAALMSDALARDADFFSIGSNDLTQYILAADRGNEQVASLYNWLDPAVLRAIHHTVRGAGAGGIPVASCGEMSSETLGMLLLVGLGVDELSVAPGQVRRVRALLGGVRASELAKLAERCLAADDIDQVLRVIRETLAPDPQFEFEERDGRWLCHWCLAETE